MKHTEYFDYMAHDTNDAYLFKNNDDDENYWLPKSQVEITKLSNGYEVEMPEWLAKEKELI